MREIKFRLWSKIAQSMISWDQVKEKPHTIFDYVNYIPMQYTGLKDKNGNEIYEGDVVSLNDGDGWEIGTEKVTFKNGSFNIAVYSNDRGQYEIYPELLEIIGNIHEDTK